MYKIFIVVGEASGDAIGAKLMTALKKFNTKLDFYGVGGDKMCAEGFRTIFPSNNLSLMGFTEIIPHLLKLSNCMKKTVEEVLEYNPDIIITIDSSGFNFRFIKKIKEHFKKQGVPIVHYVAPMVWAYNLKRAFEVSKLYDHILLILPFEAQYFKHMPCTFVGNPIIA